MKRTAAENFGRVTSRSFSCYQDLCVGGLQTVPRCSSERPPHVCTSLGGSEAHFSALFLQPAKHCTLNPNSNHDSHTTTNSPTLCVCSLRHRSLPLSTDRVYSLTPGPTAMDPQHINKSAPRGVSDPMDEYEACISTRLPLN